jgi:hypothetical protein
VVRRRRRGDQDCVGSEDSAVVKFLNVTAATLKNML